MSDGQSGRASGGQLEDRVDLSSETTEKVSQAQALASSGNLKDGLSLLAALEKKCRVGNDTPSLVRVCEASLDLCWQCGDMEALVATISSLCSRRSQKSKAIGAIVSKALPWVVQDDGFTPAEPGKLGAEARDKLVEQLRAITDGKMYLEAERARLTRTLAIVKEAAGDVGGAADTLQEVHVETYGSISKREKVEFILEQMRLTLAKRDFVRAAIVSNKIQRKVLSEEGMEHEKIKFYTLLSEYHCHDKDALELAKDYHAIYSTPSVQQGDQWKDALMNTVVFLCLANYGNEQQDMMNRIHLDPNMDKIPACRQTIQSFLKKEIIHYPLPHQTTLESIPNFSPHWHTTFHTRIIQHNIRVASLYYRQIHTTRLAELLNLTPSELETHVSRMVSEGMVYAKINRPANIIRFAQPKTPEKVLSDWASDIGSLLHLVEETTYLIHKENMIQAHS